MIDFDCKYVLNVPDHMKEAYWTGYLLDLINTPIGEYARLLFVYPDVGAFDAVVLLRAESDRCTIVSLLNLDFLFRLQDIRNVSENALLFYNVGLNIDAASGLAIALLVISELLAASGESEHYENLADCCGLPMSVDQAIEMLEPCPEMEIPF